MSDSQFETVFRSKYVWNSNTYINFWLECRSVCMIPTNSRILEGANIDTLAADVVWPGVREWIEMLQTGTGTRIRTSTGTEIVFETIFERLRYDDRREQFGRYQTSLSHLLRLIRNNYQHRNEFIENKQKILRWYKQTFNNGQQEWKFCENRFARFWIQAFPMLTPFLWKEFCRFSTSWENANASFYWENGVINSGTNLNHVQFVNDLWSAASNQVDNGGLYKRYRLTSFNKEWMLEFRKLSNDLIDHALNKLKIVAIKVSAEYNLYYRVFSELAEITENLSWTRVSTEEWKDKPCTIIIVNSYTDAYPIIANEKFASRNLPNYTVIIFEKETQNKTLDSLSDIARNFFNTRDFAQHHEHQVRFTDLSPVTKRAILSGQEYKINIGINAFLFRDIFPNDPPSELNGDALNDFLSTRIIEVCPKAQPSEENTFNMPREVANAFINPRHKHNLLLGRPFVGKTAAANYHSREFTTPNVSLFVAKCQWNNRQNVLSADGLINSFVRDNPLHSCIIHSLVQNEMHEVHIIVDCDFPETQLLDKNIDIVSEIEKFCGDIDTHTSESVRIFIVLRPLWASKIKGMYKKNKYKMTERVAISVIQNDSSYFDARKEFPNIDDFDNKVLGLVKNNFELSPIYWSAILEHIKNSSSLPDPRTNFAALAKLVKDTYFNNYVFEHYKSLHLRLYAKIALELYKEFSVEVNKSKKEKEEKKNIFTDLENYLRHYSQMYDDLNWLLDFGLLKLDKHSRLKFYDSKMQLCFFVLGMLECVKANNDKTDEAGRANAILIFMKYSYNTDVPETYKQLTEIQEENM